VKAFARVVSPKNASAGAKAAVLSAKSLPSVSSANALASNATIGTSAPTAGTSPTSASSTPTAGGGAPSGIVKGVQQTVAGIAPTLPPAVLVPLIKAETVYTTTLADSAIALRNAALLAERAALLALTRRNDSLLAVAGVLPLAPEAMPVVDSIVVPPLKNRWSVLLAGSPERSFLGLTAPVADTTAALRRTHEQGRGGWNVAALGEYRLNQRWSLGVGVGLSTTGAELRLTDRKTVVNVTYDTTISRTQQTDQVSTRAYSVQLVPDPRLTPRFNLNGQVIGYDTVWVPRPDTTWTVYTSTKLTETTTRTVTPLIDRHEQVNARILRPSYHFLTLPLLVRFRLGRLIDWDGSPRASRWWADVALGTQLQWFLGGSHLVTEDGGRTYRTERVGSHGAAFRPLSLAVMGQVAVNYAITPRLAASVAPTLRWQAQSVYKTSTGLTQKPTTTGVQLGLRYSF
jgi:opacity protein-like surface antigen